MHIGFVVIFACVEYFQNLLSKGRLYTACEQHVRIAALLCICAAQQCKRVQAVFSLSHSYRIQY